MSYVHLSHIFNKMKEKLFSTKLLSYLHLTLTIETYKQVTFYKPNVTLNLVDFL